MKPSRIVTCALAVVALSCTSTLQVSTDYAPGTDFSKYKTFTMKSGAGGENQIAVTRLLTSIENALKARGLTSVKDAGDLNVFVHVSLGKDTQISSYGYGGWGGWRWGGGMQTTQVQQIPTGTLVVDLVDASTKTAVWRGTAKDEISTTMSPEDRQKKTDEVTQKLFAGFPPGSVK
jgi:hypothetical protein